MKRKVWLSFAALLLACTSLKAQPYAFVAGNGNDQLSIIDMATDAQVTSFDFSPNPEPSERIRGITISPARTKVYLTLRDLNAVQVINVDTTYSTLPTLGATISVGLEPYGASFTPDGNYVYVNNGTSGSISVINALTETVDTTFSVGNQPVGIAISPDGTKMVTANRLSSSVMIYSLPSNERDTTITITGEPYGVAMSKDGTRAFVANRGSDALIIIDLTGDSILHEVAVGDYPTGVAVLPDGTKAYTSNANDNTVSVIDLTVSPPVEITAVAVGNSPWDVGVKPDGSEIYVTNRINAGGGGSGFVSIIDATTDLVNGDVPDGSLAARRPVGFGDFTGSTFDIPSSPAPGLPVELLGLRARALEDKIQLSWETASEVNNAGFVIQRSQMGKDWVDLGDIKGYGTTNEAQFYQFQDYQVKPGQVYYYRLKQVDLDGAETLSRMIAVSLPSEQHTIVGLRAGDNTIAVYRDAGRVEILNLMGQSLYRQSLSASPTLLRVPELTTGIYVLRIFHPNGAVESRKIRW